MIPVPNRRMANVRERYVAQLFKPDDRQWHVYHVEPNQVKSVLICGATDAVIANQFKIENGEAASPEYDPNQGSARSHGAGLPPACFLNRNQTERRMDFGIEVKGDPELPHDAYPIFFELVVTYVDVCSR